MVDANGFPEDNDVESTYVPEDDQESPEETEEDPIMELHRWYFGRELYFSSSSSSSSSDEEDESQGGKQQFNRRSFSPPQSTGPKEKTDLRLSGSSGPEVQRPKDSQGHSFSTPTGVLSLIHI